MLKLPQEERIELDRDQVTAVLAYARRKGLSPEAVVRLALSALLAGQAEVDEASAPNLPPGFVSRHPERDYSSFGAMKGKFPEGIEFENAIREEW